MPELKTEKRAATASPKKDYCWLCAEQFPMSELVEDDNPYIKDETDPKDKNYMCKRCVEADEYGA